MSTLRKRFEQPALAALPKLTPQERALVQRELAEIAEGDYDGHQPLVEELRKLAAAVPERAYHDSAQVLLRMHEIAGSGNYQSCLSSLQLIRACFELDLIPEVGKAPAELIVGRGHIAPGFYAESYVRGSFPLAPLTTLHQGGLTGVIHRDLGFKNTMRYSLGVGVAQAVSLAMDLARRGDERKVVCLAGDGELQEGVTFECLRFAYEMGLSNLVLVVDANGCGIEPLRKPLNPNYLASFLPQVHQVDGQDAEAIQHALGALLHRPGSAALVCHTRKGEHSFKPANGAAKPANGNAKPTMPSFAGTSGRMLAAYQQRTGQELAVFTADMAARFGLRGHLPYDNTGLAETLSVGLTLLLPEDTLKVIATDAMYYMDSLSMVTEASTSVRNLLVLAGRSWGAWGGAHNATNLLGLLLGVRVYEPITPAEFNAVLDRLAAHPGTAHVASMVDASFTPPGIDCSSRLDGAVWMTPPATARPRAALVTFGYASVLVAEANRDVGLPHLHCAALDPELPPDTLAVLAGCRRIASVEYNGAQGGFGERLRAKYLLPLEVHGIRHDIANRVHARQLALHGMDPQTLRGLLTRLGSQEVDDVPAYA
ncbi:1-deoxy-D-xylulose-5-phosphate synthase N-terminal domain-containing protein [Polyangium sp. 15x6]|uniref:1-deoxy-D-xylulose-5-phosphate synthase N-terminal domain-containing protein n=1 Tax=Polyangium sp. 15x6 TaxID=3042687 RepID=UPI00249B370F|nr:1-deoxy-D-xylulose-5-phosphate synthase N-terminal domain-containing protein [Polyangium sp. 15x6]MDI3282574.1 1-deoxy-D-xylulose-5-phosphate synthase N-terminal domain-containing protein [Polyangium sp. 15x6]